MQKILMLQVLLRYFSGIFQVLFRYLPHLNKLTKSHIHEKAEETFVLSIKKIGMIQEVENASGFFTKYLRFTRYFSGIYLR